VANRDKTALILAGGQIVLKYISALPDGALLDQEEIFAYFSDALPEMKEKIYVVEWSQQPVCHYTLRMCGDLVQLAGAQIEEGASGIVVTCGTQALTEIAYFADLVWSYPQSLIFTASIYHAGTPGADTALSLSRAAQAAQSQACWGQGVLVHVDSKLYAASEVFHLSNTSRDGYSAIPCGPVAEFSEPTGAMVVHRSPRRHKIMNIETLPARHVEILDASLGGGDILLNALLDGRVSELDGLVIAAFGGGDIPPSWVPLLRKVMRASGGESPIPVVLASRCLAGRVQAEDDFEGCAKRLLEMGLISAGVLTPLQARIRLAVALGAELTGQELRAYMLNE
jgi:L-asparaginase